MILRQWHRRFLLSVFCFVLLCLLPGRVDASYGDRLPEFKECISVCVKENCQKGNFSLPTHLRLLLWTCPSNCDYICQHIITDTRLSQNPPGAPVVVQYHGKWPFYRFLGMQEPFSVLFSLLNFAAHHDGLRKVRQSIPVEYPLRPYYVLLAYFGLASWTFSMIFHTRDFNVTEKLDYIAAGASVFYGLFYAPVRVFRLDRRSPGKRRALRAWTALCAALFAGHVGYLTLGRWDYGYNMAANVAAGAVQNGLWTGFSVSAYRRRQPPWTAWPGLIVAWIVLAMSLELLDFPPLAGLIDAHSLWHLGTVGPTVWWYNFLIKDAQQDSDDARVKA